MRQLNGCFLFQVKNKAPAPVQITAEQLLREAKERQLELVPAVSRYVYHVYFWVLIVLEHLMFWYPFIRSVFFIFVFNSLPNKRSVILMSYKNTNFAKERLAISYCFFLLVGVLA